MQYSGRWRRKFTFILSITAYFLIFLNVIAIFFVLSRNLIIDVHVPFYVIIIPIGFLYFLPIKYEFIWVTILVVVILTAFFLMSFNFVKFVRGKDKKFGIFTELLIIYISFTFLTAFISGYITGSPYPFGNPTSNLPLNYLLLELLNAPVWEEIVYRIFLLGIPAYLIFQKGNIPWYRAFIGGKFKLNKGTIVILFISSFFFGTAHLSSWEPAKLPSVILAGLILGFLFLRYGVYMSISMHFIIDFMVYSYLNTPFWNIMAILSTLILIIWFFAGFPYYWIYIKSIFVRKENPKEEKMMDVQTIRQKNYVLGYEIRCPYCGFDKFEVIEGNKLKCLRCGGIFQIKK